MNSGGMASHASHSTAGGGPRDDGASLEVGGKVRKGRSPNRGKLRNGRSSPQNPPQNLAMPVVPTYQLVPVGIKDSHSAVSSSGAEQDRQEQSFAWRQMQHLQQQHMQKRQQHMQNLKILEHHLSKLDHPLARSSARRPPQFMRVCRMTSNEGRKPGQGGETEDTHLEDGHCNSSHQTRPLCETPVQPERPPTSNKSSRNARRPHGGSGSERLLIRSPSVSISGASAGQCATGSGRGPESRKETEGPAGRVPRLRFSQIGAQDRERSLTSRDREHSFNAQSSSNILPLITHRRGPANGAPSAGGQQRQDTARASLFDEDMLDRHHALRNSNEEPDAPPLLNFKHLPQHAQWCWRGADQLHTDSKAVYLESKSLSLRELAERRREVRARCSASACDSICPICHPAPAAADPVTSVPL
jgi:hypothetical protein